jgi:K(+)-stimulated pyrophosphate-energized sodium pump
MIIALSFLAALAALIFAASLSFRILRLSPGLPQMQEISLAVQKGSSAYLRRQIATLFPVVVLLSMLLMLFVEPIAGSTFMFGALLSAAAGFFGMNISVRAAVRTANAAKKGLANALNVAFKGGTVTGMMVVGLALLGVAALYAYTGSPFAIVGMGFGASLISLFMRVGGGIYTKAADVGADLVGKVEKGIPEDDPRNPAVIADNVGDNVGDCAGMAADLFESYVVTLIAAMLLGFSIGSAGVLFPLGVGALAIFASVIATFFVRLQNNDIWAALNRGIIVAAVISAFLFYLLAQFLFADYLRIFLATLVGLVVTIGIGYITDFYTGRRTKAVKEIAEAATTGAGTNIITGFANGLRSTWPTVLLIAAGIFFAHYFAGVYGIALAALGMLSVTGMVISVDSYGPITDNAGGIAEMANLSKKVRKITDALDAVGNTTKAVTKGFAIGAAALAALSLFAAYAEATKLTVIDILQPAVVIGLFIGGALPFLFSAFLMKSVGKAAFAVVNEVRLQFRKFPEIMKGKRKPDYERVVDLTTAAAQKEFFTPVLIAVAVPILVGFLLGAAALAGLLAGSIVTGFLLAVTLANAGAAWDNAKKYIEEGKLGGKGSDAHKAAVIGDTVGDPAKDTAGPSLNPLIKVINMIAILLAALVVTYAIF